MYDLRARKSSPPLPSLSLSFSFKTSDAIKIFFTKRCFASGARCTSCEIAHTGLADHVTIITCLGTGQKFGALEPRRCLEMSAMLVSRGQVELFGEQPTVSFLSPFLSFFLAFVPHPPFSFLFPSFFFYLSSLFFFLYFSLFSTFFFARLVHSYTAVAVPQARQRRDQATRKNHLVLCILVPAAMILSTAFKNIRRPRWISQRKGTLIIIDLFIFAGFF